jgi:hypothetical protein
LIVRPATPAFPSALTVRLTSITVPAGRMPVRAGAGIAGGGPAGAAPRIRSSARSSASRLDGTVLISCPPMLGEPVAVCGQCGSLVALFPEDLTWRHYRGAIDAFGVQVKFDAGHKPAVEWYLLEELPEEMLV